MPKRTRGTWDIWSRSLGRAIVFTPVLLLGCSQRPSVLNPPVPVRVSVAKPLQESGRLRYSANITAFTQVVLAFKSAGYVDSILQRTGADGRQRILQVGDQVTRGEVLAQVREAEYMDRVNSAKAQLQEAQAGYDKAKQDFGRAANLFASDSLTKTQYDAAKASLDSSAAGIENAQANLQQAETALRDCSLKSPLDGWVVDRTIEIGSFAGIGTQAFTLARTDLVKAVFGVPDTQISTVKLGAPQAISTSSLPGEFRGRITGVSASADPKSRVFSVEVTIPNPGDRLKPGMIATIVLNAGKLTQSGIAIPLSAVVRSSKRPDSFAVFVISEEGGRIFARERQVEVGETAGNMVDATQGLMVGDRVVTLGATQIKDGDEVKVIP
jgi:RND family efflux transporter MFP subunit